MTTLAELYRELLDTSVLVQPGILVPQAAAPDELSRLEGELGFKLPPQLREILEVSNGASANVFGDAGIFTAEEILENWRFCSGAVQASPGVPLVPIACDNGIFAFMVADPKHKKFQAVGTWDPDGDPYGELSGFKAKSLHELVEKAASAARRQLPKGVPVLSGLAFGKTPSNEQIDALVGTLATSKKTVDTVLGVFENTPAIQRTLVERLLGESKTFITFEEHDAYIAKHAATIDLDTVLAALKLRTVKKPMSYEERYFVGWTAHLDDAMVTFVSRDAGKVAEAAAAFGRDATDGYTLVAKRLGINDAPITNALKRRIAQEGNHPPYHVRRIANGETVDVRHEESGLPVLEFAYGPFFDSLDEHGRMVLEWVLAGEDLVFPRWVGGPCMRVATLDELEILFQRMGTIRRYDILQNLNTAARPMSAMLAAVCERFMGSVRQTIAFCACVAATREGVALPDVDQAMTGYNDFYSEQDFVREFSDVFRALGPARVSKIFAHSPAILSAAEF